MTTYSRILPLLAALALTQACTLMHSPEINQGNFITSELIEQLEVGMTRDQVRDLFGYPAAQNPFRGERWDFVYYLDSGYRDNQHSHLVVWFDGDEVSRFENRVPPAR